MSTPIPGWMSLYIRMQMTWQSKCEGACGTASTDSHISSFISEEEEEKKKSISGKALTAVSCSHLYNPFQWSWDRGQKKSKPFPTWRNIPIFLFILSRSYPSFIHCLHRRIKVFGCCRNSAPRSLLRNPLRTADARMTFPGWRGAGSYREDPGPCPG